MRKKILLGILIVLILIWLSSMRLFRINQDAKLKYLNDNFTGNEELVNTKGTFYETYKNHDHYIANKWEQYLHIYDKVLAPFILANKPVNLLEIGVQNGGSLEVFADHLPKGSKITGIDIDPKCANLKFDKNINLVIGDGTDEKVIDKYFSKSKFDIIVDDGSHINEHVIKSFEELFPKLNYGGLYIIEDVHTSYWRNYYHGDYKEPKSTIEYFKNLIDALNYLYIPEFPIKTSKNDILKLKKLNKEIASITFYDSVIIIEKYTKPKNRPFKNYYAGTKGIVVRPEAFGMSKDINCNKKTKFEKFYK